MTVKDAAHEVLLSAKAKYEADGYVVGLRERLPEPFDQFTADAIARRGDELVVVEVKPADMSDRARDRLARLSDILGSGCGWRLDIYTYSPEMQPAQPAIDEVERRVHEARDIAGASPEAAALLMWSAVEGALLWIAHEREIAPADPLPKRSLVQQLTIDGILSDNQAAELKAFADHRNAIAHGMTADSLTPERFDWLGRFTLAIAHGRHADLHDMVTWFHSNYALPDDAGLPYLSDVDGYDWRGSGPHDAEDVLRDRFEDALDADIDEAVAIVERDSTEWARRDVL